MTNALPKAARLAVLTIFFVNGATIASWVPHIPLVQEKLGLSEGLLGLALLGVALGAVVSLTLSGWLIARIGSRTVTSVSTLAFCLSLPLPVLAPTFALLVLALVFFGLCNGAMDVAMNTQAIAVEERYHRPIMSSFHGLFSLGGLFGAGVGGLALESGVNPSLHVWGAAFLFGTIGAVVLHHLLPQQLEAVSDGPAFVLPKGPLLGLGLLAFVVFVGEGAMADWSAVYLRNVLGTSAGFAAAGFAAFSLMMALGRLTGDSVVGRLGPTVTVRLGSVVAGAGLGVSLLTAARRYRRFRLRRAWARQSRPGIFQRGGAYAGCCARYGHRSCCYAWLLRVVDGSTRDRLRGRTRDTHRGARARCRSPCARSSVCRINTCWTETHE